MTSRVIAVLLFLGSASSTSCAPMMLGPQPYTRPRVALALTPPPAGRWDLVMSLEAGWVVMVLDADGIRHTGRFLGADRDAVRLVQHGQEVSIARADVVRVDLVQRLPAGKDTVKRVAAGAAAGALANAAAISILGSVITGKFWIPPARSLAAGAAAGGMVAAERDASERRPRTIYIAPAFRTY